MFEKNDLSALVNEIRSLLNEQSFSCASLLNTALASVTSNITHNVSKSVPACVFLPEAATSIDGPVGLIISSQWDKLAWRVPGFGMINTSISDRIAVTELVGPTGMIKHDSVSMGLLLMAPNLRYPSHSHAAEELYIVLSGTIEWTIQDKSIGALKPKMAVRHKPWQPHEMKTRDAPALLFWGWTGDIRSETYRMN